MFNRKNAKRIAKQSLKSHYGIFLIACLIVAFLGVAYGDSLSAVDYFSSSNVESAALEGTRTTV